MWAILSVFLGVVDTKYAYVFSYKLIFYYWYLVVNKMIRNLKKKKKTVNV